MRLPALLRDRRAQLGAAAALAVIVLALVRKRGAAQVAGAPAASTISEQALGGDPNPAFEGPVTFADNGGYATSLGNSITESLAQVSDALSGFTGAFDAQQELLAGHIAQPATPAAVTAAPGALASVGQPAPVPAAPAPTGVSVAVHDAGPVATSHPAPTPTSTTTHVATAPTYTRPSGGAWDGSNVFRQDAGSRAGQWYRVVQKDGHSYRYYQDGTVVRIS